MELVEPVRWNRYQHTIQEVLDKSEVVFNNPIGLSPRCCRDHVITLKEGTAPISVRPYRYPYVQKQEIEKLLGEMLVVGIIHPSISPFSTLYC